MSRVENKILVEGSRYFQITLSDEQIEQFMKYYELLVEWNSFMNLTSITEKDQVMQKHFVDSLALVKAVDIKNCRKMVDIGTGAGFPGIPLKIAFPHINVVLLDSLNKRVKFLNEVISKLGLTGITAVHGRAEDYAKDTLYREQFDLCVSRAVANLASLSEYCIPFVKVGGLFISYKSGEVEEELRGAKKAVYLMGGQQREVIKFCLPDSDIDRSLVVVEKVKGTPKKYPRKSGLPTKEPLK